MEAVRVWDPQELGYDLADERLTKLVVEDLQATMDSLVKYLFGNVQTRWIPAYFPFTHPSFETGDFFYGSMGRNARMRYNAP